MQAATKKQKVSKRTDDDEATRATVPRPGSLSFITNEKSDAIQHEDAEFESPKFESRSRTGASSSHDNVDDRYMINI